MEKHSQVRPFLLKGEKGWRDSFLNADLIAPRVSSGSICLGAYGDERRTRQKNPSLARETPLGSVPRKTQEGDAKLLVYVYCTNMHYDSATVIF